MKKNLFKAGAALLYNALMGVMIALFIGVAPVFGAVGAGAVSLCAGNFMNGNLCAGVLTEVWTGELVKALRAGDVATFLDGIPDYSSYAENDVIHLVDVGGDPDVLVNNTTYPIAVQDLADGDLTFSLDKYQTKATPVTDDELYAISYDKMTSVKERHAESILEKKYEKAIHALAPAANAANAPVLLTTGEYEGGGTSGRRRIIRADIVNLKKKFDALQIPTAGRRLVLCSDHVNDLLLVDQKFAEQYYNYTTGKIANMYGFEVFEYVNNPSYTSAGAKLAFGAVPTEGQYQASVAFYTKRCFKAMGSTKMYHSPAETDPLNQRNLVNFRHYYIVLPKKAGSFGAIVSSYVAA